MRLRDNQRCAIGGADEARDEAGRGSKRVPAYIWLLAQTWAECRRPFGLICASCPLFHFSCSDKFGVARYLFQGQCRDVCPEGFFHSARKLCEPCPADCGACVAADRCLSCSPGHKLRDNQCVPLVCSEGETRPTSQTPEPGRHHSQTSSIIDRVPFSLNVLNALSLFGSIGILRFENVPQLCVLQGPSCDTRVSVLGDKRLRRAGLSTLHNHLQQHLGESSGFTSGSVITKMRDVGAPRMTCFSLLVCRFGQARWWTPARRTASTATKAASNANRVSPSPFPPPASPLPAPFTFTVKETAA